MALRSLKFCYNGEARRISIHASAHLFRQGFVHGGVTLDQVKSMASTTFPDLTDKNFDLKYKDEEQDIVTVSSDAELVEALAVVGYLGSTVLRFEIQVREAPHVVEATQQAKPVHRSIICDGCGANPIVGVRYKCSVRDDFDLCEVCEREDSSGHAYLKIKTPDQAPAAIMTVLKRGQHTRCPAALLPRHGAQFLHTIRRAERTHGFAQAAPAAESQVDIGGGGGGAEFAGDLGIFGSFLVRTKWNGEHFLTIKPAGIEYKGVKIAASAVQVFPVPGHSPRLKFSVHVPHQTTEWAAGRVGLTETFDIKFASGGSTFEGVFQRESEGPLDTSGERQEASSAPEAALEAVFKVSGVPVPKVLRLECAAAVKEFGPFSGVKKFNGTLVLRAPGARTQGAPTCPKNGPKPWKLGGCLRIGRGGAVDLAGNGGPWASFHLDPLDRTTEKTASGNPVAKVRLLNATRKYCLAGVGGKLVGVPASERGPHTTFTLVPVDAPVDASELRDEVDPVWEALDATATPPPKAPEAAAKVKAAPAVHLGVVCDRSGMSPLVGPRYHVLGNNYDLCEAEFDKLPEAERCLYVRIDQPGASSVPCLMQEPKAAEQPAAAEQAAAAEQPACSFVADVTVPDGCEVAPQEWLVKTWRLRNDGDLAFPAGVKLECAGGNLCLGAEAAAPVAVAGPVRPLEEFEVSVRFQTPAGAGQYKGLWQLATAEGERFGHVLWAEVQVKDSVRKAAEQDVFQFASEELKADKKAGMEKMDERASSKKLEVLEAHEHSFLVLPPASQAKVVRAWYGDPKSRWSAKAVGRGRFVTAKVEELQRQAKGREATVYAENRVFGDTCLWVVKTLLVEVERVQIETPSPGDDDLSDSLELEMPELEPSLPSSSAASVAPEELLAYEEDLADSMPGLDGLRDSCPSLAVSGAELGASLPDLIHVTSEKGFSAPLGLAGASELTASEVALKKLCDKVTTDHWGAEQANNLSDDLLGSCPSLGDGLGDYLSDGDGSDSEEGSMPDLDEGAVSPGSTGGWEEVYGEEDAEGAEEAGRLSGSEDLAASAEGTALCGSALNEAGLAAEASEGGQLSASVLGQLDAHAETIKFEELMKKWGLAVARLGDMGFDDVGRILESCEARCGGDPKQFKEAKITQVVNDLLSKMPPLNQ